MKIAVLSDIHGNIEAFKKVVECVTKEKVDRFFFLGDYLGEHAYPQETMKLLYSIMDNYECDLIRGNKEDYWIKESSAEKTGEGCIQNNIWKEVDHTTGCLYYTYTRLTEKDLLLFSSLPISREIHIPGMKDITICHGTPRNNREHMSRRMNQEFEEMMDVCVHTDLSLCGHSHIRNREVYGEKVVQDIGSVGVSAGANGMAQYAILESEGNNLNLFIKDTDYDRKKALQNLEDDGLFTYAPYWTDITRRLIFDGEVMHSTVLFKAMELCEKGEGSVKWPMIPDKYWDMAIKEIF